MRPGANKVNPKRFPIASKARLRTYPYSVSAAQLLRFRFGVLDESMPSCDGMLQWEEEMRRSLFATLAMTLVGVAAASCPETQAAEPATSGGRNADASFEWIYSCTNGKGCAFNCAGAGLATHVTKLTVQLRRLEIGNENALALFYDYSTMEVPSGNGFSINTGLGTLSCQVNGMHLDYFGAPNSRLLD